MLRNYSSNDAGAVLGLWNTAGVKLGYARQDAQGLDALMLRHKSFSAEHAFVLDCGGKVCGFTCGSVGDELSQGKIRGYLSCLILDDAHDSDDNTAALLDALETSFRQSGKSVSAVTFFNPVRLPWVIPGTSGHQHNNMPGIPTDIPLYERMLRHGYHKATTEMAMYLDLKGFSYPEALNEKEREMARQGYFVDWYAEGKHHGVDEMVETLENSMWSEEIPSAAHCGMKLLVGLQGDTVAGFTGPVYPEPTGRGYFAGIAVAPGYQGHGLGKLLFYKLCQAEKDCGAEYMSLFTGIDNHAQKIYKEAGFEARRYFAVMLKEL